MSLSAYPEEPWLLIFCGASGSQWLLIFQENLSKTALELAGCKHSGCRGRRSKSSPPDQSF